MSEKLTESITFKCTYEEKRALEAIARSDSKTMGLTTDTVNIPDFELTAEPMLKPQAQKKPNCCDQLSLIAVHSDK